MNGLPPQEVLRELAALLKHLHAPAVLTLKTPGFRARFKVVPGPVEPPKEPKEKPGGKAVGGT